MEFACQKNYVVYLTDGLPTLDVSANSKVPALPRFNNVVGLPSCDGPNPNPDGDGGSSQSGRCADDLAEYLFKTDISSLPGQQNVTTYTIGFGSSVQAG